MNWLILTIVSAITFSLSRVLQKIMLKHDESDSFAFSFIFPMLVSLAILGYTLFTGTFELPNLLPVWINMIMMIIFYSVGGVCIYQAFKESPASEVSIIFTSSSAWAVLSAIIFLGEKLAPTNILGILAIIIGVIVINYQKSNWKLEKGHLYALIASFMFGVAFTNDAFIMKYYHTAAPYVFLAFILPAFAILLYRPKLIRSLPHYFSKAIIGKLFLTSAIYALSSIAIYTAYKIGGKASIITPIQQSNVVITVILSYFLLNEKDKLLQKIVGAILVFGGALLLL
jgi:uncharacterized membrane protein